MDVQKFFQIRFPAFGCRLLPDFPDPLFSQISNGLIDPVLLKPVIRAIRVAVKPEFTSFHGAAACCLIDEALRHQGNLIKKDPRQSDALDEVLAAFVLAAEYVKIILNAPPCHDQQVIRPMICNLIATAFQHQLQPEQDVPAEAADGLSAHGEVLSGETAHGPHYEGQ